MIQDIMDFLSQADPRGGGIYSEGIRPGAAQHEADRLRNRQQRPSCWPWALVSPISMRRAIPESGITEAAMP